jgi:hypothetical protein
MNKKTRKKEQSKKGAGAKANGRCHKELRHGCSHILNSGNDPGKTISTLF